MPKDQKENLEEIRSKGEFQNPFMKTDFRWTVFLQSTSLTLAIILLFGGAGWWIDKIYQTGHRFLIIMLVVSYPITMFTLYRKMKKFPLPKIPKN